MKLAAAALSFVALAAAALPTHAQEAPPVVPVGCSTVITGAASIGEWVDVWVTGEAWPHVYVARVDSGTYTVAIDKHPSVAAVVVIDDHEMTQGARVSLARPGYITIEVGAELTWRDVPGTCYHFRFTLVPAVRATRRRPVQPVPWSGDNVHRAFRQANLIGMEGRMETPWVIEVAGGPVALPVANFVRVNTWAWALLGRDQQAYAACRALAASYGVTGESAVRLALECAGRVLEYGIQ